MKFYDCTVRPAGSLLHEVPKQGLSAAEVVLLRSIHGDDGVVHLKPSKVKGDLSDAAERQRLSAVYGEKAVAKVFSATYGAALPQEVLPDWLHGEAQDDEPAPERPVLSRNASSPAHAK